MYIMHTCIHSMYKCITYIYTCYVTHTYACYNIYIYIEQLIEIQKLSIEAKGKTINGHKFVVRCSINNTFKIIELQNKNE